MSGHAKQIGPDFRVGDWIVRPARDCIEHGGELAHLAPKAMQVLQALARADGKVVSRQDLFDSVWPGCAVSDDALTQRIVEIRKAFGDPARAPAVIETIPKVGFRLIPKVEPIHRSGVSASAELVQPRRLNAIKPVLALALLLPMALLLGFYLIGFSGIEQARVEALEPGDRSGPVQKTLSVVVLPFADRGASNDDLQLMRAFHEEILTRLTHVESIRVISHESAERFRDVPDSPREIARILGVSAVVTGSVQRVGDLLAIHTRLIDAKSGEYLWAESFEIEPDVRNYFAIQSEIALDVATALSVSLSPGESARIADIPTDNYEAYRALLQGRFALEKPSLESFNQALMHYERALQINPDFAQAHIAIAGAWSTALEDRGVSQSVANVEIEKHARLALELNPDLGHAYKFLGQVLRERGHFEEAERHFRKALVLDPGNVHVLHGLGLTLRLKGQLSEAVQYYDRAVELDPLSPIINESRGSLLRDLGRFDEAEKQYLSTIDIDPGFVWTYWALGTNEWSRGDPGAAIGWFEEAVRLAPRSDVFQTWLALMYLELERDEVARQVLDRAMSSVRPTPDNDAFLVEELYRIYRNLEPAGLPDGRRSLPRGMYGGLVDLPLRPLMEGQYEEAIRQYEQYHPGITSAEIDIDGSNLRVAVQVAFALERLGRHSQAGALLDRAESAVARMQRLGIHGHWVTDAQIMAIRGDYAGSLARLETAFREGWRNLWRFHLMHDPILLSLRQQPGFYALLTQMRLDMVGRPFDSIAAMPPTSAFDP